MYAYMYFCTLLECPVYMKPQETIKSPLTVVPDGFMLQYGYWKLDSGSLEGKLVPYKMNYLFIPNIINFKNITL